MKPFAGFGAWLGRRTTTQLAGALAVTAALALAGSLFVTGWAVRADLRQQAALQALDDYGVLAEKLGVEAAFDATNLTQADAAFLSAWLSAFQSGPTRDAATLAQTCNSGRGGAGVRFIRGPVGKPAGLAALGEASGSRARRLGEDVWIVRLDKGELCASRAVEVVAVRRRLGALDVVVGRVVEPSGAVWGWSAVAVLTAGGLLLFTGLAAATFARRRLTGGVARVSAALDRAAVGDFSVRAPHTAPELEVLTDHVNGAIDRLEDMVGWMRDSADQTAHDFRTPLARAAARLERLEEGLDGDDRDLARAARQDLAQLTRAMNEALLLRDGQAWTFEPVELDAVMRQVADLYEPVAEQRGVRLRLDLQPATTQGVQGLIQRAAANLVDNAVKHAPSGTTVTLTTAPGAPGPSLTVADQGPGFGGGPRPDSHGMGLAFVRAVLRRHGATLTIDDGAPGAVVTAQFPR